MEYQGIIFDFNGTLFFDNDKHVKSWNEISKILRGKEITLEELHTKLNGTPNIQNILYFTDGKATKEELEKYSQKKEEYYRQFCKEDTEKLIKSNYPILSCSLRLNDIYYSKIIGRNILDLTKSNCMYSKIMYAIPNILPSEDSDEKVGEINLLLMNVGGEYPIIFTECNEGSLVPSEEDLILGLILLKEQKSSFIYDQIIG